MRTLEVPRSVSVHRRWVVRHEVSNLIDNGPNAILTVHFLSVVPNVRWDSGDFFWQKHLNIWRAVGLFSGVKSLLLSF